MKDKNFFIEELKKVTLENKRRITEKRVFIQCPYHGKDNTPSFKINIDPNNRKAAMGSGYCFACKTKKTWNELCEKLGMTPLKTDSGAGASGIGYVMRASEDTKKA